MAVIQISRIQIRRGQTAEQGMPTLASGEMGWSVDEQRLFIGNGSVAEGAPAVGNTEVLTEERMFDLLSTGKFTATTYIYQGHGIAPVQTGVAANTPIVRTLQKKLDDNVTAFDFGLVDSTDSTAKLQQAIDELYLRAFDKNLPKSRIPLRIPAGVYYTTATVYVPPYASLIGDGIDKTVIRSINPGNTTIFATIAGDSTDTDRNTGSDINSPYQPRNISISGMTLEHTGTIGTIQTTPIVHLDYAENVSLSDIKFKGTYAKGTTATTQNSAINIVNNSNNLTIKSCQFEDLSYPIISNWNVSDISIKENTFKNLFKGITLSATLLTAVPGRNFGPRRVDIYDNLFQGIEREAIWVGANTGTNNQINSENNHFIDVGNNLLGEPNPATPIISFLSHGNSSTNDNFERLWYMQTTNLNTRQYEIIEGTAQVRLKFMDKVVINESTLTQTLARIPYANTVTSVTIDYTLEKPGIARKGTLNVVASSAGISHKDSYAVAGNSDGDTILTAAFLDHGPVDFNDTLAVQYTNPVSVGTGTMIFTVAYYR
jgi:hypothetical protein